MPVVEMNRKALPGTGGLKELSASPSILVAIANHGTKQDHFMARLLAELRALELPVTPVVMTNKPKRVEGAEVLVGVPGPDPYSLPFAHRRLFAERIDQFDLFLYTEDDMLITGRHIKAFLELQPKLKEDELLGFLRSETDATGQVFITSINSHFRWLPDTVVSRDGEVFAQLSNQHAGCFMVTRAQLRKAIDSGGFLVPPHAGKYGMLESAATDIYLRCGFRRLVCLSRVEECIIPHLPNKYYKRLGVPIEDLRDSGQALLELHEQGGWTGSLFEPRTNEFGFRWSKHLYLEADVELLSRVNDGDKKVLVVGSTFGKNEQWLRAKGFDVTAIPLDFVFGRLLRKRGIRTVEGGFEQAMTQLSNERFGAIFLPDVLHLVSEPVNWLEQLRSLLRPGGEVILSLPNSGDVLTRIKDKRSGRVPLGTDFQRSGVHRVSKAVLQRWLKAAGFDRCSVTGVLEPDHDHAARRRGFTLMKGTFATRFIASGRVG